MDNLKQFNTMGSDDNWRTSNFRQNVVSKIEDVIQRSGMQVARNSSEMENHVYMKAKTREEYMNMVAKLILHVREMSQPKQNQAGGAMQGSNQNQPGPNTQVQAQQSQAPQGPNSQSGLAPDPINALQNLASQGTRNQMMNMGQGQMQQQGVMGPNPGMGGLQAQIGQQGPIVSQGGPQSQAATNLLQTLNQRPPLNMQLQNKLGMGMVPNQNQMGNNMVSMGGMGNPMGSQLQNQLAGPGMQGQMMPNMSMSNNMQGPMTGGGMGQMQCNQVGGMGGQMAPNAMQGQMSRQMVGGMGNNQMVNMNMLHMQGRVGAKGEVVGAMLGAGYAPAGAPPPNQFLRQSPSPSASSPNMGGPSPVSMGGSVLGGALASPMSMGGLGACGGVGSPSPSAPTHLAHHPAQQQRVGVGLGMAASPSSLSTPGGGAGGGGVASPGGEEAVYREKVRQLSKYIEPLRRMVQRMVNEGENVEKLTKMKNLLDILSNPNKRMPLETLIKCEVVLEKLDFKRSETGSMPLPHAATGKQEQIFNPFLEVVNNCLTSPLANHTLKRSFGATLDALNGPEIKNLPPPLKMPKVEEPTMEIPDVLQGEIARLDSRFKVSLETMQVCGGSGAIALVAQLDDVRLPCVPAVHVAVPRDYPAHAPARLRTRAPHAPHAPHAPPASHRAFLAQVDRNMDARCASLPKSCSVGQLLDAWEMSVRQACAPSAPSAPPLAYTPVPALGL
ncbi:PREDICTED: mediator of RNA polymerase II transcription subunit 15 isoform X2 [Papilio polytes]|uniref:mediator of RNA polymerase II transcription subunit 15 isoform X2 n=1 Tax=Papilio polytes TaxID=76194 RepID=UPI000676B164|nr:PREDICTED: mediator of RNA polymerase II transcription subunit 15 isoform X2 [Papilio polytes]